MFFTVESAMVNLNGYEESSEDVLESVATMTELSALVYLGKRRVQHLVVIGDGSGYGRLSSAPTNDYSRCINITLDEQGDVVLHDVVHAITLALDTEETHFVFTVTCGCEDDVGGGGRHDGL